MLKNKNFLKIRLPHIFTVSLFRLLINTVSLCLLLSIWSTLSIFKHKKNHKTIQYVHKSPLFCKLNTPIRDMKVQYFQHNLLISTEVPFFQFKLESHIVFRYKELSIFCGSEHFFWFQKGGKKSLGQIFPGVREWGYVGISRGGLT